MSRVIVNKGVGILCRVKVGHTAPTQRFLAMAAAEERPVEGMIRKKLTEEFQPIHLDIINESYMHSVPKGSETHFKVVVISQKFEKLPLIKRHRMVNQTLQEELGAGVHALSILAKTPDQWSQSEQTVEKSPPCLGGFGH